MDADILRIGGMRIDVVWHGNRNNCFPAQWGLTITLNVFILGFPVLGICCEHIGHDHATSMASHLDTAGQCAGH